MRSTPARAKAPGRSEMRVSCAMERRYEHMQHVSPAGTRTKCSGPRGWVRRARGTTTQSRTLSGVTENGGRLWPFCEKVGGALLVVGGIWVTVVATRPQIHWGWFAIGTAIGAVGFVVLMAGIVGQHSIWPLSPKAPPLIAFDETARTADDEEDDTVRRGITSRVARTISPPTSVGFSPSTAKGGNGGRGICGNDGGAGGDGSIGGAGGGGGGPGGGGGGGQGGGGWQIRQNPDGSTEMIPTPGGAGGRGGGDTGGEGGGAVNVRSHNQRGGITAHTVNLQAPSPSVRAALVRRNQPDGSRFLTSVRVELEAQDAIPGLMVIVQGQAIESFNMNPVDFGEKHFDTSVVGPNGEDPPWTRVTRTWTPPLGRTYELNVWTPQPEQLEIEAFPTSPGPATIRP